MLNNFKLKNSNGMYGSKIKKEYIKEGELFIYKSERNLKM